MPEDQQHGPHKIQDHHVRCYHRHHRANVSVLLISLREYDDLAEYGISDVSTLIGKSPTRYAASTSSGAMSTSGTGNGDRRQNRPLGNGDGNDEANDNGDYHKGGKQGKELMFNCSTASARLIVATVARCCS